MKSFPDKIKFGIGGGLGDVYWRYLVLDGEWRRLQSLKEASPKTKILVTNTCTNPQGYELIRYNPYIDEIINNKDKPLESQSAYLETFTTWDNKWQKTLTPKPHKIYFTQEDTEFLSSLFSCRKKYIAVHPFSGKPNEQDWSPRGNRMPIPPQEYTRLFDGLIAQGIGIVLLGGNDHLGKNSKFAEKIDYEKDGFINLIDKANSRVNAQIIMNASGFIGTYSCFLAIAWWKKIPSVVFLNPEWKDRVESWDRWAWALKEKQNKILYVNTEDHIAGYGTTTEVAFEQALKHFA